jgi:2-isopropylmalate synthase
MFSAINRKVKRMVLRYQKAKPLVRVSDTTLRDGLQTPGVHLEIHEKVRVAEALADAGIHSIDCGFPAAGPADVEAVRSIAACVDEPVLSVHARTKREDIDAAAEALSNVSPFKKAITLFIGVSPLHREFKHEMTKSQVIDAIVKAVEYAQPEFEIISFGPEDASRTEPDYLIEVYREAIAAGALSIGFTDTVGILTPDKAADAVKRIQDRLPNIDDAMLAVHFHNDLGLATANALACVKAGVNIVQGTINGIGERAGNTALEELVTVLTLHREEFGRAVTVDPSKLYALSRLVAQLTGFQPAPNKAVIGRNIFRTETGVHQSAILKKRETYMPFPPELVGAGPVELGLGPNSGRSAVRYHLEAAGLEPSDEHVQMVLNLLKNGDHTAGEQPEINAFFERIKPFMNEGMRRKRAGLEAARAAARAPAEAPSA